MTVSVVVVTMNRPGHVQTCLDRLAAQVPRPDQVIVIDASPDDRTRDVVARHPGVLYRRNELGYGHMTASRNIGLAAATGDVVSFIDDDAFAHPGWLAGLLDAYRLHPEAAAVGSELSVHIVGAERKARVIAPSPYDPFGKAMRA